jgi:hypothetical protein
LVTALETPEVRRAERRWVLACLVAVAAILAAQVLAGVVRETMSNEPSHLEKVEICLTERSTPFDPVVDDFVALSAGRGALRTSIGGNGVTVALGGSEKDAERVFDAYEAVGTDVTSRLERRRKVVFLWDAPPSGAQRDFMILCTLDAQD